MKPIRISKKLFIIILFLIMEALFIKTFMYSILPGKYFFDAHRILSIMQNASSADASYMFVANIFKAVDFFHLTSVQEWGILITIIFVPFFIYGITREKTYNTQQYIFIIVSFTLLDIYVLGLSKEIVQFIYVFLIYLILLNKKMSNPVKVIFMSLVLLHEALNFRIYYGIMAMLIVTLYFIFTRFADKKQMTKKSIFKIILLVLVTFFVEILVVSLVSSDNYQAILNARYSVNIWRVNDPNANTIIFDPLGANTNYIKFILNYMINAVRMVIPVELFVEGPLQILFGIYQIYISFIVFKAMKKMDHDNCLWFLVYISYLMVSILFEPDFGSWVRHESVFFLIILKITGIEYQGSEEMETNESIACGYVI